MFLRCNFINLWSSSLDLEEDESSTLNFSFHSSFSALALSFPEANLLASTYIEFVCMSSNVLETLSLSMNTKSSSNALEYLTFAAATGGLRSTGILW